MNILYLCDEYPPGKHGGIGTSVRLLARQVAKLGHKVVVAGLYGPGYGGANEFEDDGVNIYRFRRGFNFKFLGDETGIASRVTTRLLKDSGLLEQDIEKSLAAYKIKLEELISKHQIDIIEMPDYNDYIRFCSGYIPFPQLPPPVVVKLHGAITYFASEAGKGAAGHTVKMEQAILKQASAVSSVSKYTAEKSAEYLCYHKNIELLYNGIDTTVSPGDIVKNSMQVIFTGSLVAKKGIYQLAKAWNIVNKNIPDARLLVLGKGSQDKVLSHLNAGAAASVIFKGHVSTTELYAYLQSSAISVFPSYAEGFALAALEAMSCGTAVINSNRTSGPELVDHETDGLLIDPDNIEQIAEAIIYLLNNPDIRETLAKKGNEKVKAKFEISNIAADNIRFYQNVLGNN